jgi:hypothetical protein
MAKVADPELRRAYLTAKAGSVVRHMRPKAEALGYLGLWRCWGVVLAFGVKSERSGAPG